MEMLSITSNREEPKTTLQEITPELIESTSSNREVQEIEEPNTALQEPNAFYKYLSSFW